ncbi:spore coat protein [Clostridium hydrogeniformans]|uniref:spore coat protein n=1 Tax=Clostridium hydrogeniformans TaxID=349933 RepID=UPI0004808669|nr:spore coat protein [Clostridium hydrogeniformans]
MQEKDMVNDYLSMINSSLAGYGGIISQTDNEELRQTIQQMRNQDELRQYKLYQTAKQKGYYKPAQQATQSEIGTVKSEFTMQNASK